MKRVIAGLVGVVLIAAGAAGIAPAAHAATVWDFPAGTITLPEAFSSNTANLAISSLQITDGSITSASMTLSSNAGMFCRPNGYSGSVASFADTGFAGCVGNLSFAVDSQGRLTVSSQALGNSHFLFNSSVTSSLVGTQPIPVPVDLAGNCPASYDAAGGVIKFGLATGHPDATAWELVVNGAPSLPAESFAPGTELEIPIAYLESGQVYSATITGTRTDGKVVAFCTTPVVTAPLPGAPSVDGDVITPIGSSTATANYSVTDPLTVQGIEYQIDGAGGWIRPGGNPPTNGAGGSFTLSGLADGKHSIQLRSVGFNSTTAITAGNSKGFVIRQSTKTGSNSNRPSQGSTSPAIGSSPTKPVAAPPAQPVSTVAGTSNGAGTGTNGALAANTGDAGIDAPCLAKDGTLYPNQYSTVGSQLTMAPNTHGMGAARSFIVTAGALPPGVQLDRAFGVLYGVTTVAGSWVTTVQATFADGSTKSSQFTTRVDADAQTLQYAAQNIGVVGSRVAIAASTNAPVTGTTYKLVCGELPTGTKFDSRTGTITGTPTAVDLMPIPLRVAESSASGKAAASFLFVVQKTGFTAISYPAHPHLRAGHTARVRPTITGVGEIALFRMWKGKLPRGLHLNAATGLIWGKPLSAGPTHTITLHAVTKGGALLTSNPMRISTRR